MFGLKPMEMLIVLPAIVAAALYFGWKARDKSDRRRIAVYGLLIAASIGFFWTFIQTSH
jgi:hypothetical protein